MSKPSEPKPKAVELGYATKSTHRADAEREDPLRSTGGLLGCFVVAVVALAISLVGGFVFIFVAALLHDATRH
ncbi:MAG: hypothetical protein QM770_19070 [Tepidisphaeraceae bacterium]